MKGDLMKRVYLFRRGDSSFYQMKWIDAAGRDCRASTGETTKAKARDVAAQKQRELLANVVKSVSGFDVFRDRYRDEFLVGKSKSHRTKFNGAMKKLEKHQDPDLVSDIDAQMVAKWVVQMNDEGIAEATIDSYLGYLARALSWAVRAKIINESPLIERLSIPDEGAAKGRPLSLEEIERMQMQCTTVVGEKQKESFLHLIDGLRLSGLRLGEAMRLWWRDGDHKKIIVHVGAYYTLEIPAMSQKKRRRQMYPLVPEFADFLAKTPIHLRAGPVFNPLRKCGARFERVDSVSKRISEMGERAGVIVKHDDETGEKKFASAQDLRRTFGLTWARLVPSIELKALMRHQKISTTEKYYAIIQADEAAASLYERFGRKAEEVESVAKEHTEEVE